ncbi:MAG TPA: Hpt domain-containing protein, partial [Flavobacterium sp.]|nr:Hpt domain-containing protein [Flavobacterium sp.]
LDEMACGNPNFRQEMIDLFIEKIPNQVAQLQEAFDRNDTNAVKRIAHNMKSSIDIFMLEDIGNWLSIIEIEAKTGQFTTKTVDKIKMMHSEIFEVVKSLKEL